MKKDETYITIVGINHYCGKKIFRIGKKFLVKKDYKNLYDDEAVKIVLSDKGTVGYVANSVNTVYRGTSSAGRIYDTFDEFCEAEVMFITHSAVIAKINLIEKNTSIDSTDDIYTSDDDCEEDDNDGDFVNEFL